MFRKLYRTPCVQNSLRGLCSTHNRFVIKPIILSDIGEGTKDVEIMKWCVKEGDVVTAWDDIVEVQSDKASVNIQTPRDGTIVKLHWSEGDTVKVGKALIDIDYTGEVEEEEETAPVAEVDPEEKKLFVTTAVKDLAKELGVDINTVVGTGTNGRITKDDVRGQSSSTGSVDQSASKENKATPPVRAYAKKQNVELHLVTGTGKDGRIEKKDIDNFLAQPVESEIPTMAAVGTGKTIELKPIVTGLREPITKQLTAIQKAMTKSMNIANTIPHFGYCEEYDLGELVKARAAMKDRVLQDYGIKLSYLPFIVKACSLALLEYPMLNSSVNSAETEMTYHPQHNIGVATDTPHGLLVPNIKNCESRTILEIAFELNRLHQAGMNNKLSPQDISGGTFTLSNIGAIGGTYAKPVIMMPQVAIGALGKMQKVPRYDSNGNVYPAHIMVGSWCADHRVIEGAQMARFSNLLKYYLENPATMLLTLK